MTFWAMELVAYERMLARWMRIGEIGAADRQKLESSAVIDEMLAAQAAAQAPTTASGGIAVIPIRGVMMRNPDIIDRLFYGAVDTNEIIASVNSAANDRQVRGIVLNVSSPGGSTPGIPELANAVASAKKKKKTLCYIDDIGASAAYWVGTQAEKVYANRFAVTGSIGVRMAAYDLSKMFEKVGVKAIPIDTGKFKSAGLEGTEFTDEMKKMYQDIVDEQFSAFKAAVKKGRGMDDEAFAKVGDGQIFAALMAKSLGLIDGISTLADVIKEAGGITGKSNQSALAEIELFRAASGLS